MQNNCKRIDTTEHDTIKPLVDCNWEQEVEIYDCIKGWCHEKWQLTLTSPQSLKLFIEDVGCPGDFFELYINDEHIGTTFKPNTWGYSQRGELSSGIFIVSLSPGTYSIKVRNAGFDDHSAEEILKEKMCPSGFKIKGTLSPLIKSVK
ncbi:hypothetical protein SAMN00017405_1429 [Desulfonispora thiosulfatigenes DSM 11270]|uniref:Uncharacterized protein n=1 Tax=Desulfonispora thiosulfatigenes DSM 11270 TaxID=656914 RepID=A0A1W1VD69_DESTI|nr:hypothetical protein [Desulfonispora thiosulfatigenes]SMB91163.1 hypothetical protein SAMN00017405_1429 [Desulfonispora thiosulfatigenes DSM 11270]